MRRGEARARSGDLDGARADFEHALRLARLGPEVETPQVVKSSRQQREEIEAVMRSVGLGSEPPPEA